MAELKFVIVAIVEGKLVLVCVLFTRWLMVVVLVKVLVEVLLGKGGVQEIEVVVLVESLKVIAVMEIGL
jgi:hypothetical protein